MPVARASMIVHHSNFSLDVTLFCYEWKLMGDQSAYILKNILKTKKDFRMNTTYCHKRALNSSDLEDLKWFMHVYCYEINRNRLLFLLHGPNGEFLLKISNHTGSVDSPCGQYEIIHEESEKKYWLRTGYKDWKTISSYEPSVCVDSLFFHYREFRQHEYLLNEIHCFPSKSISIPYQFNNVSARKFLQDWHESVLPKAKDDNLVTVKMLNGDVRIFKQYQYKMMKPNPYIFCLRL